MVCPAILLIELEIATNGRTLFIDFAAEIRIEVYAALAPFFTMRHIREGRRDGWSDTTCSAIIITHRRSVGRYFVT